MEKKTKPLLISTPRGDKSPFDDFWKIKRSELEALKKKPENYEIAKMYRDTMRSTPKVEKLLRQRRKQNEEKLAFNRNIMEVE